MHTNHQTGLSGPDFLDAVADAEAAQGNDINAAEFRRRARQWRESEQAHEQLDETVEQLREQIRSAQARLAA